MPSRPPELRLFEETTPQERLASRRSAFAHQIALVLLPTLRALRRRGIWKALAAPGGASAPDLARSSSARLGYLNVALRALASLGWLHGWRAPVTWEDTQRGAALRLTPAGSAAFAELERAGDLFDASADFLDFGEGAEEWLFGPNPPPAPSPRAFVERVRAAELRGASGPVLDTFFQGLVLAPLLVALSRRGAFAVRGAGTDVCVHDCVEPAALGAMLRGRLETEVLPLLAAQGWAEGAPGELRLTPRGKIAVFLAPSYAITLSYLPLFRHAEELLFGPRRFQDLFPRVQGRETHLRRPLNIWGSGGAHDLYFRALGEAVQRLFAGPDPPLAICDTGCGDGSLLVHMHRILAQRLHWDFRARPVWFLGADLNAESRRRAARSLEEAGVPQARVIEADMDINFPDRLAAEIAALRLPVRDPESSATRPLAAADALHTNSMLIHNRVFLAPEPGGADPDSRTDGAYADETGAPVPGMLLQRNLADFLRRWAPHVRRYGWLFVELHTLPVATVAADPLRTPTVAFDLTHGFTHQFTVEPDELLRAAAAAGMRPGPAEYQFRFPDPAQPRVSVMYLVKA
ncbi:MAG: class I SAM-dependent methyltransferase [Planctomycetota bacterium]|nr:MAG: class I SAM-dependent methyltransferase [Planctomycetota bacterium]